MHEHVLEHAQDQVRGLVPERQLAMELEPVAARHARVQRLEMEHELAKELELARELGLVRGERVRQQATVLGRVQEQ